MLRRQRKLAQRRVRGRMCTSLDHSRTTAGAPQTGLRQAQAEQKRPQTQMRGAAGDLWLRKTGVCPECQRQGSEPEPATASHTGPNGSDNSVPLTRRSQEDARKPSLSCQATPRLPCPSATFSSPALSRIRQRGRSCVRFGGSALGVAYWFRAKALSEQWAQRCCSCGRAALHSDVAPGRRSANWNACSAR